MPIENLDERFFLIFNLIESGLFCASVVSFKMMLLHISMQIDNQLLLPNLAFCGS